jgi:hypothetical protein
VAVNASAAGIAVIASARRILWMPFITIAPFHRASLAG